MFSRHTIVEAVDGVVGGIAQEVVGAVHIKEENGRLRKQIENLQRRLEIAVERNSKLSRTVSANTDELNSLQADYRAQARLLNDLRDILSCRTWRKRRQVRRALAAMQEYFTAP